MKKILFAIVSIFALAACVKEELPQPQQQIADGDKVTLTFDVKVPEAGSATRAMGNESIEYLDVIVFNEAGHHVKTARATLLDGNDIPTAPNTKSFRVTLDSSSSQRRIHFIANGNASQIAAITGHEDGAISKLFVSGTNDAYWQRMVYDGGIGTAADAFGGDNRVIPLIRNYARVTVDNQAADFTLTGYKVFNTRTDGSVAAYDYDAGAWVNFSNENLTAKSYVELASYTPLESGELLNKSTDTNYDDFEYLGQEEFAYVRETKNGQKDPNHPFVVVRGKRSGDATTYYYKLDFVYDQGGWANILRNFEYKFVIKNVEKNGYKLVADAIAQSSGENSLSYDMGTESFLNISDGTGQLYVNATTVILVNGEQTFELKYKYIPDVKNAHDVTANGSVNVGGLDGGTVIESYDKAGSDVNGWRSIIINPFNAPTGGKEVQPVTLSTTTGLARVVNFILRAPYSLKVNAYDGQSQNKDDEMIPATQASKVWVDVTIPADIDASLFPLEFVFETKHNTLSPDAEFNTMPVRTGQTIITYPDPKDKPTATTFGFVYTLTEEEYGGLTPTDGKKTFTAKFKTSTAASATTVWVDNLYFAKDAASASDDFENSKAGENRTLSVSLSDEAYYYGEGHEVTVTLGNLAATSSVPVDVTINSGLVETRAKISTTYNNGTHTFKLYTSGWNPARNITVGCGDVETDAAIITYNNGSASVTVNKLYIPAGSFDSNISSERSVSVTGGTGSITFNNDGTNDEAVITYPGLSSSSALTLSYSTYGSSTMYTATTTVEAAMSENRDDITFAEPPVQTLNVYSKTNNLSNNTTYTVDIRIGGYSGTGSQSIGTVDNYKKSNNSRLSTTIDISSYNLTNGSTIYFVAKSGNSTYYAKATVQYVNNSKDLSFSNRQN